MIIPLSEHQLRTYLHTGKVTVEIPCTREHSQETPGPSNDSLFYDPAEWRKWAERHPERAASTTVWGDAWKNCETGESGVDWSWGHEDGGGTTELEAPCLPGERVAIGEEFYLDRLDYELGRIPVRRPDNLDERDIYYRIDGECCAQIPECACAEVGEPEWSPPDIMPEWAARHHATVKTIAFERCGDVWAWIVGLESK